MGKGEQASTAEEKREKRDRASKQSPWGGEMT